MYLQVAQTGEAQDWNARFSGMMFKVLQDSYASSGLAKESEARTQTLASLSPDRSGWHPVRSLFLFFMSVSAVNGTCSRPVLVRHSCWGVLSVRGVCLGHLHSNVLPSEYIIYKGLGFRV